MSDSVVSMEGCRKVIRQKRQDSLGLFVSCIEMVMDRLFSVECFYSRQTDED